MAKKKTTAVNSVAKKVKPQKAKTVQETIPYEAFYQNGMVLNKPGVFSRTYCYTDVNFIMETEEKQEAIMENFRKILNKFGPNVVAQYSIINSKVDPAVLEEDYYIHAKNNGVEHENERIQNLREEYNNRIIQEKIKEGRNDIRKNRYITVSVAAPDVIIANRTFDSLEVELKGAFELVNKHCKVSLLNAEQRMSLFREILQSGSNFNLPRQLDKYRNSEGELSLEKMAKRGVTTKDIIAPCAITNGSDEIILGENLLARSFLISDLPPSMDSKFMSEITNIPCAMVVSVIHKTEPKKKTIQKIKIHNNSIKAEVVKANQNAIKNNYDPSLISENLQNARDEASFLMQDVTINNQKVFYTTATVTLLAESEKDLEEFTETLEMKVSDFSCQALHLKGQQLLAFKNALPLAENHIANDRMLTSESACAFFPFSIQELMDKGGHFYGLNAITKNMIMINRRNLPLPNGLIFGKSGSGKSYITKGEIIPNLLDNDDDMIILDPDGEYVATCDAFEGVTVDISLKSENHINPLDMDMYYNDTDEYGNHKQEDDPLADKLDYLVDLVESIVGESGLSPFDVSTIQRCGKRMYAAYIEMMEGLKAEADKKYDEKHVPDKERTYKSIDTKSCPTLANFYQELIGDESQEGQRLAMAIEPYAIGQYNIFANKTNIEGSPRLLVYNLKKMPAKMREMTMKICLSHIWNQVLINKTLGKATWVYLDEFYTMCKTPLAASTLQMYYKRIRKYGGVMTGITQDIEDVLLTAEGRGILNNSGFFLMMNQSQIGRAELAEQFEIAPSLLNYIKDMPPGNGLVYNGESVIPFNYHLPTDSALHKLMTTKLGEY